MIKERKPKEKVLTKKKINTDAPTKVILENGSKKKAKKNNVAVFSFDTRISAAYMYIQETLCKISLFKNISKKNNTKKVLIVFLGLIIIVILFFSYCTIATTSKLFYKKMVTKTSSKPTWGPAEAFFSSQVKVMGARQLPKGCDHWRNQCWRDAIASGVVKFIATPARVLIPGYEHKPIVFAYFKNTTTATGVSGYYNFLPIYLDDGTPVDRDITGGVSLEVDWVYGSNDGLIIHENKTGYCFESYFDAKSKTWLNRSAICPI